MKLVLAFCCLAAPGFAQVELPVASPPERADSATGGVVRVLDKVSGALKDITLTDGETTRYGRLDITLTDCRYPADNPASDAFAFLTISDVGASTPAFKGWMIASSPALNALDHPRYDVWVLRCNNT